jgi:hypothetical protein
MAVPANQPQFAILGADGLAQLFSDVRKHHHALGKILDRLRGIAPADIDGEWADLENHLAQYVRVPSAHYVL